MGLVTNVTEWMEIPHEPGERMQFRKLSWRQLDENTTAKSMRGIEQMKRMGGDLASAIISAVKGEAPGEDEDVPDAIRDAFTDPLKDFDLELLLEEGIVAWTYDVPLSAEAIGQLDDTTARWAGEQIVRLTRGTRTEAERGEGSSPSI